VNVATRSLKQGRSVVIDRCNFDAAQRQHWLTIAERFRGSAKVSVVAVLFNTPMNECKQRVMNRRDHPTLPPNDNSIKIVERFRGLLKPPVRAEGFDLILEAESDFSEVVPVCKSAHPAFTYSACVSYREGGL
jgi:predicted kinase